MTVQKYVFMNYLHNLHIQDDQLNMAAFFWYLGKSDLSPWKGEVIKSVGIEYQVVKRRREYYRCGEKREKGSNIIIPKISRLSGRISSVQIVEEDGSFTKENQNIKKGGGEEYQVARELYTALLDPLEVLGPVCHNLPHLCSDVHPQAEADVKLPK